MTIHNSNITADETWAASDNPHIITANFSVGQAGGARITLTIQPECSVYFAANYNIAGVNDNTAYGAVVASANSWETRIRFAASAAEPANNAWAGFRNINDLDLTFRFCHFSSTNGTPQFYGDGAGGDGGNIDFRNCLWELSNYVFYAVNTAAVSVTASVVFKSNLVMTSRGITGDLWANRIVTYLNSWDVSDIYVVDLSGGGISTGDDMDFDFPFDFTRWIFNGIPDAQPMVSIVMDASQQAPNFTDCYFRGASNTAGGALSLQPANLKPTVQGCLFWSNYYGFDSNNAAHYGDIDLKNCDFIENNLYGASFRNGGLVGDLTNSYFYKNNGRYCVEPGSAADEFQYINVEGSILLSQTPNMPLEIIHLVEGTPSQDSVTITYDCASGAQGEQLLGCPFIRYGLASDLYTESTIVPLSPEELGFAFTRIKPQYPAFAKSGHSVTINNLKAGTTYYYRPCFVDPLGRIAEGTEGSFTTEAADGGGAGGGTPKLGTTRAGDTPVLG